MTAPSVRPRRSASPGRALVAVAVALLLAACGTGDDAEADPAGSTTVPGDVGAAGAGADPAGGVRGTVTVFAAASLTDVFAEVATAFEEAHPEASVTFSFGPSSGLVTQVIEGAPADVVATASEATMDELVEADVLDGDPVPFATNGLEIAVPPGNPGDVEGLADLADEDLVVALCAEEVPCGTFARQALATAGVEPAIDSEEQDVRALLTKVAADEVDAGIVYRTDVVAAGDGVEGIAIPADDDVEATYPVAVPAGAGDVDAAHAFVDLLLSDEGRALLADAGFGPP
ncbi:molybdate ABC transporter substrate-binding protein [Iamia majanohamensis]|uniref:Molybdate ABC transporter substrate-binding protein n=1 Tax=Iamia majanohamensis TaxID=467976 RepID=A0AAE9YIL4_9ACTN|nr:molybdate ABC transporter substrate-binding protein [Iamia majanohamensis]WCO68636.1 molybdate ABC transporter substrate-binding protein [Iamia majanohamensis]